VRRGTEAEGTSEREARAVTASRARALRVARAPLPDPPRLRPSPHQPSSSPRQAVSTTARLHFPSTSWRSVRPPCPSHANFLPLREQQAVSSTATVLGTRTRGRALRSGAFSCVGFACQASWQTGVASRYRAGPLDAEVGNHGMIWATLSLGTLSRERGRLSL
jgi:hypothetical protein